LKESILDKDNDLFLIGRKEGRKEERNKNNWKYSFRTIGIVKSTYKVSLMDI
jgi:hypothetical protein